MVASLLSRPSPTIAAGRPRRDADPPNVPNPLTISPLMTATRAWALHRSGRLSRWIASSTAVDLRGEHQTTREETVAMANPLLDFVMSLVRDPDAAARYAADPAQAIADANLVDVTSADVQNLIPVVSESLSMATPTHGRGRLRCRPGRQRVDQRRGDRGVRRVRRPSVGTGSCTRTARRGPEVVVDDDQVFDVLTNADLLDPATSLQLDEPLIEEPAMSITVTDARPVTTTGPRRRASPIPGTTARGSTSSTDRST